MANSPVRAQGKESILYDSKPKNREGEPIESIVPEAISTTASRHREDTGNGQGTSTPWPEWLPESRQAFAMVAALALVEALALFLILVL